MMKQTWLLIEFWEGKEMVDILYSLPFILTVREISLLLSSHFKLVFPLSLSIQFILSCHLDLDHCCHHLPAPANSVASDRCGWGTCQRVCSRCAQLKLSLYLTHLPCDIQGHMALGPCSLWVLVCCFLPSPPPALTVHKASSYHRVFAHPGPLLLRLLLTASSGCFRT